MSRVWGTLALTALLGSWFVPASADPAAAERQYRIARRLAAEGSGDAAEALRRVVELAPEGPLADDAVVELALLAGIPHWPEEIGKIEASSARAARELLDAVADEDRLDRSDQAKIHRALLLLEPLPGHDPSKARIDLVAVATGKRSSSWAARARYVLAWLHEREVDLRRAAAAYQRVIVDYPHSPAASRARVGAGRILLRKGRPGAAARLFQEAIDSGAPAETQVEALRELAIRALLRPEHDGDAVRTGVASRNPCCLYATANGGLIVGDRRQDLVLRLDPAGVVRDEWAVEDLHAVVVDFAGGAYAAAGASILRLESGGSIRRVAPLGDFAPVSSLAADGGGTFWFADRRGQRVGRVRPGADAPEPIWSDRDVRLASLAWDGTRLVGVDLRSRTVMTLSVDGALKVLVDAGLVRPIQISADPGGRLAVLDVKAGRVHVLNADGFLLRDHAFEIDGLERPSWTGLGLDGSFHLFDTAAGEWVRRP